jgi:thymidylate kinase
VSSQAPVAGDSTVVAIVGADGAGKSTLTALLAERLSGAGIPARRVDRWDVIGDPHYPTAACLADDTRLARSCAARMSGAPRLLFLLWISVLALTDGENTAPDDVVLLDGYWMKHAASEIVSGTDRAWVEATVSGLPPADVVVYLRVDPEVAWHRKNGKPVPYECGMDLACGHQSFFRHQGAIQGVLDRWAERFGWLVVDADTPPAVQADRLARTITDARAVSWSGDAH